MSLIYSVEAFNRRRGVWEPMSLSDDEHEAELVARSIRQAGQEARVVSTARPVKCSWDRLERARNRKRGQPRNYGYLSRKRNGPWQ